MQWLFDNPLANLPGPVFLGLYAAVLVGSILFLRVLVARLYQGTGKPPLPIPESPDPFQIAYLRGGESEVIRTVMVDLVDQGRLVVQDVSGVMKWVGKGAMKWVVPDPNDRGEDLSPVHQVVMETFRTPRASEAVLETNTRDRVRKETAGWQSWIEDEELVVEPDARVQFRLIHALAILGFVVLGMYKLASAWMHHRSNVGFLIGMMFVGGFLLMLSGSHRRLTLRGRNYLKDLQSAFESVRSLSTMEKSHREPQPAFGDASLPLLAMGVFGVSALQGSSFDPLYRAYQKSAVTGAGCGASGCGSSCGSGSDSSSSCSGGSSCGGGSGCGGCGGGGD